MRQSAHLRPLFPQVCPCRLLCWVNGRSIRAVLGRPGLPPSLRHEAQWVSLGQSLSLACCKDTERGPRERSGWPRAEACFQASSGNHFDLVDFFKNLRRACAVLECFLKTYCCFDRIPPGSYGCGLLWYCTVLKPRERPAMFLGMAAGLGVLLAACITSLGGGTCHSALSCSGAHGQARREARAWPP